MIKFLTNILLLLLVIGCTESVDEKKASAESEFNLEDYITAELIAQSLGQIWFVIEIPDNGHSGMALYAKTHESELIIGKMNMPQSGYYPLMINVAADNQIEWHFVGERSSFSGQSSDFIDYKQLTKGWGNKNGPIKLGDLIMCMGYHRASTTPPEEEGDIHLYLAGYE